MPLLADCPIVKREEVAEGHFLLAVRAPEIAASAKPGQFAMLQTSPGLYPFLRRPMSLAHIFPDGIAFLFKVEGEGTRLLAGMAPGQELSVQGPLGNGFPIDHGFRRHIIVAGGIGVAPCPPLAEALIQTAPNPPDVIIAARNQDLLLCENEFHRMGCPVHIATDDGSAGERALATEMLERLDPGRDTRVYTCGPMPMMSAISTMAAQYGFDCQVSLEAQMACGDGACLGCVIEARTEHEGEKMLRVCADGPVFDASVIDWTAHNLAYDL